MKTNPALVAATACVTLTVLFLSGCASPPKLSSITSVNNDDAAYLVFGALGQTEKQREVATRIAGRAYDEIRVMAPVDDSRNVHDWEEYLESLEKPIAIDASSYQQAPELKPVADLKLVGDYIAANPDSLNLDGAEFSTGWSDDLTRARSLVKDLHATVEVAVQEAEARAGEKLWSEAYAAIGKAVAIAPKDKKVLGIAAGIQEKVTSVTVKDLERVMKQVDELRATFGTPESSVKKIAAVEDKLATALEQALSIEAMLAVTAIPVSDQNDVKKLASLRATVMGVRGSIWAEVIRVEASGKKFWSAYQSTISALAKIESLPALKETGAREQVITAYGDQLDDSVHFLLEKSNEAYYRDRFGVAFVASRMCREVYDYALTLGISERPKVLAKVQQADQTAADATQRIGSQFSRRLLVTDFVPAVTEDYENIGYQIRTRCRYLTLPGNGLAWALDVPAPISLALDTIGNVTPLDLGLSGVMDKKIQVDVLPPIELERGFMDVGTMLIREVPNPMFDILDDQPRLVFSQEVHLYPWIKTLHRKQARIAFRVVREVLNGAATNIYQVDETFPNEEMKFDGLAIEAENLSYHPIIMGTPRVSTNKVDLVADAPPVGRAPALAPNDEIASAVINHVITGVMNAIEQEVAQFPVENMAAKAVAFQVAKQNEAAADAWGHFLVYIDNLVPVANADETSWLKRRVELSAFIEKWNQIRWSKQPADVLAGTRQAWKNALTAYLGIE